MARTPRLGPKIDQFFKLRKERLALESKADKIKIKEGVLKDQLIVDMDFQEVDSSSGVLGTVSITRPEIFRASDWPKLYAWIKKTGTFEVLSPRLHQSNINEQFESFTPAKKAKGIPGIEKGTVVKFHATAKRGM
jgi:hypothetical protein